MCIRDRVDSHNDYYKNMCSISTALDSAIQADQTYDQSILDAASLEIKNNINYDKFGVRGLVRLLQLIYARCTSSGGLTINMLSIIPTVIFVIVTGFAGMLEIVLTIVA